VLRDAEGFACESREAIAVDGIARGLAGDGEAETRIRELVGSSQHGEQLVRCSQILFEHTREIFVPAETCASWQKIAGRGGALGGAHGELRV